MESNKLDRSVVIQKVMEILKSKGEWIQDQTKLDFHLIQIKNCTVYLIQINCVSSTMMLSQNWPRQWLSNDSKPVAFAFRALEQKIGRGQRQNRWESPKGNLYLTLLFKLDFRYFPYLPLISIENLFEVVDLNLKSCQQHKSLVKIKWINDIVVDFQKVSGILIKNQVCGQNFSSEIGIGVNIKNCPQNLDSIKQSISFLQKYTKNQISIEQFSHQLIQKFIERFFVLNFQSIKSSVKQNYEKNIAYLNRSVIIYDHKYQSILGHGIFKGINEYGHAILEGYQKPFVQGRMKVENYAL